MHIEGRLGRDGGCSGNDRREPEKADRDPSSTALETQHVGFCTSSPSGKASKVPVWIFEAARSAAMEAEPQPLYLGVDDEPADLREVQAWLCQRLGKRPSSLESSALRPRPVGKRCLNTLLKASGYVLRYPSFKEGYASLPDA